MLQIIKHTNDKSTGNIKMTTLSNPDSLDRYDINLIDLNENTIWKNKVNNITSIDSINDFKSLGRMINETKTSINIIVLPQDQFFYYNFTRDNYSRPEKYQKHIRLKDMIVHLKDDLITNIFSLKNNLMFENNSTKIKNREIKSSFYFKDVSDNEIVNRSIGSNKVTTFLAQERLFITTLDLKSTECIEEFIEFLGLGSKKEESPEWVNDIHFFNDIDHKENILGSQKEIDDLKEEIFLSNTQLQENLRYKSILYTNGDELVEVVFDILNIMFKYDLSSFVDEKKEDFIIKLEDLTFIGEIKGVNSNVKSLHVSQLDVHYQDYSENSFESGKNENVKSLLVINHQRNKNPDDRKSVHAKQIELANRNKSLIIDTATLLKLFEKFKNLKITSEEIKELLKSHSGLLIID